MLATVVLALVAALLILVLALWLLGERGRLMRPSTWRLIREGGRLHGYVYGRWTRQYINLLLNHLPPKPGVGKWFADHYHGKVLTKEQAQAILSSKRDIPLQDLEQIIPYPTARNLVLKGPPDVAAYECVCRHARQQSCQPTQVCMVIGQPFVDFIVEHHPHTSRRLTQAEALELLEAEHQRGHLHSAWFKDAMLNRFYAICNCCKCCCGGLEATRIARSLKHGKDLSIMIPSGYAVEHHPEDCKLCGACEKICFFGAIKKQGQVMTYDRGICMGCGLCVEKCKNSARSLSRDFKNLFPLDLDLVKEKLQ